MNHVAWDGVGGILRLVSRERSSSMSWRGAMLLYTWWFLSQHCPRDFCIRVCVVLKFLAFAFLLARGRTQVTISSELTVLSVIA